MDANSISRKLQGVISIRLMALIPNLLVLIAPLASIVVIGFVTGTGVFSIDAWNTEWNDERHYYWTVRQMRMFGMPEGVAGYNEVQLPFDSYGPYAIFVYIPYFLGSFIFGFESHNFIYATNVFFAVLSATCIVCILRPTTRQAIFFAVFSFFHFIASRYYCSGMVEASYMLFASIFASCVVWLGCKADSSSGQWKIIAAYCTVIASLFFWGTMRPFLLAFILIPTALLFFKQELLPQVLRVVFLVSIVFCVLGAVTLFFYFATHTPSYFGESPSERLLSLPTMSFQEILVLHTNALISFGGSLIRLQWTGILVLLFASAWLCVFVLCLKNKKQNSKSVYLVIVFLLLAGLAILESNVLLYSPSRIGRMLFPVIMVYAVYIGFLANLPSCGAANYGRVFIACLIVLCSTSLLLRPASFALPQEDSALSKSEAKSIQAHLENLIPHSENPWDNTIAFPVEVEGFAFYYYLPAYTRTNCCQDDYLKKALAQHSLSSKYLSLPDSSPLNKEAKKEYELIYEGMGHILYQTR